MIFAGDNFSEFDKVELVGTLPAAGSWVGAVCKESVWRPCTTAPEREGVYRIRMVEGVEMLPNVWTGSKWTYEGDGYIDQFVQRATCEWLDAPPAQVNAVAREVSSSIGSSTRNQAELSVAAAPSPGDITLQRKEWREWFGAYQSTQKFGERNE